MSCSYCCTLKREQHFVKSSSLTSFCLLIIGIRTYVLHDLLWIFFLQIYYKIHSLYFYARQVMFMKPQPYWKKICIIFFCLYGSMMCVCSCGYVCAHVSVLLRKYARLWEFSLIYPACIAHVPYTLSFAVCLAPQCFSTLPNWRHVFRKKVIEHKICVFIFPRNFSSKYFSFKEEFSEVLS